MNCIVTQQGHQATTSPSGCVLGRTVGLRYGQPYARHDLRHSRPAQGRAVLARMGGLVREVYRDTRFCIVTGDKGVVLRYSAAARHDTAQGGSRHGREGSHDMVPVRAVRAAWVQWACSLGSGCAPGAPNPVLDSVHCFSHCLDHCS